MFYVFNTNGPMFEGSHERLSQIAAVRGVARPAALRSNTADIRQRHEQGQTPTGNATDAAPQRQAAQLRSAYGQDAPRERRRLELVADVMTRGALTVHPQMTVEAAWSLLSQHQVGQVPVINDSDRVVGLLLRADMAPPSLARSPGPAMAQRRVAEVMVTPVPAVSEDTALRRLAYVLMDTGLPGLPVTDAQGVLSGFVSRTDILRAVAADPPLDMWG
ncbi:Uncharacterised protein [uncultured Comamonas sp.]|nr:Uncharacterised protein [uncultured Comamonas sp.]